MQISVYNSKGETVGEKKIKDLKEITEKDKKLVSLAVVAFLSNLRRPIAQAKTRGEVRGGGRKPWRQKGTGRARAGSIRSPLWVGGGVVFGPTKERNFKKKINKKTREKALSLALKEKIKTSKLLVLDNFNLKEGKTKEMDEILKKIIGKNISKNSQIILTLAKKNDLVLRSARNIAGLELSKIDSLNVYHVLKNKYLLTDKEGFEKIKELVLKYD